MFVKLHTDILGDPKLLDAARRGAKHLALLPWLLAFAKRADDGGRLSINGRPADPRIIARDLPGVTVRKVVQALAELHAIGVISRDSDDVFRFVSWEKRAETKPSDSKSAINLRVTAHRNRVREARNSNNANESVTPCNALQVPECNATEKEKEEEKEKENPPTPHVKPKRRAPRKPSRSAATPPAGSADAEGGTAASAEPPPPPPAPSWSTQAGEDWAQARGGTAPFARIGHALRPLVERDGWDVVRPAWQRFVASPRARFGAEHFAANFNDFAAAPASPTAANEAEAAWQLAADLYTLYDSTGLIRNQERDWWITRGKELVEEGRYPSVESFLDELRVTKPWTLTRVASEDEAIAKIRQRLANAHRSPSAVIGSIGRAIA